MRIVPPLAIVTLSTIAWPQIPTFSGTVHSSDWPSTFAAGPFRRIECGHLTPDPIPDVVVLNGTSPAVSYGTDAFEAFLELGVTANDVDILPRIAGQALESLVTVGATGAHAHMFDSATGQFIARPLFTGSWQGALQVHTADLAQDGTPDLIGVSATGVRILVLRGSVVAQAGGPGGQTGQPQLGFTVWNSFSTLAPVRDVLELEWDGDAQHEIAVLTDQGIEIHDVDGTLLNYWDGLFPSGSIARIQHDDSSTDWLCWTSSLTAQGWEWLFTVSQQGGIESAIQLGVIGSVGAIGVDYDNDGDDDVLISQQWSHDALLAVNQRQAGVDPGPVFSTQAQDLQLFPVGPTATAHPENVLKRPLASDLDNDGDADIVFASESTRQFHVFRGETVAEDDFRFDLQNLNYDWAGGATGTLTHELTAPSNIPASATHILALGWRRTGATDPVESALALPEQRIPRGTWPLTVQHVIPESDPSFTNVYTLQYAFIRENASGAIVEIWPVGTWDFTLDDDVFDALRNLSDSGAIYFISSSSQHHDGGTYGGGFVSFPDAGDWDEDDWPDWEPDDS